MKKKNIEMQEKLDSLAITFLVYIKLYKLIVTNQLIISSDSTLIKCI